MHIHLHRNCIEIAGCITHKYKYSIFCPQKKKKVRFGWNNMRISKVNVKTMLKHFG